MKSFLFSLTCLMLCFSTSFGQETILDFQCEQKSKSLKKETFSISNGVNNKLALFIKEKKTIQAYLFDAFFKIESQFEFQALKKKKYDIALGTKVIGNKYSLFYSNGNYNKFCVFTADFTSKKSEIKEFDFDLGRERYLKTVSHKNTIYFLTTTNYNEIIIRELSDDYNLKIIKTHTLDLHKKQELHAESSFGLITLDGSQKSSVFEIVNTIPNSIELASEGSKIYKEDDFLYLTFDDKKMQSTTMMIIDLTDFNIERKEFAYPKGKLDDFKRKNSYFLNNKLFQIASSNNEIIIAAKSMNDSVLKSYYFQKEEPINIKNSSIIQEGRTAVPFVTKREFDETSKFLRKISLGRLGISAYKDGGYYHLTIGGVKEIRNGAPMMMNTGAPTYSMSNNALTVTPNVSPVYSSYNSYTSTKSTYFNTTFDLSFNYIKEERGTNIFEKIKTYSEALKYCSNEDVFYHNNELYFSYFNMKESRYKLVKF